MTASVDYDRTRGALLGLAVGDALGAPVEGLSAAEIGERHGTLTEMVGGGPHGLGPGQGTDDTDMAICLARTLISSGGFDPGSRSASTSPGSAASRSASGGRPRACSRASTPGCPRPRRRTRSTRPRAG